MVLGQNICKHCLVFKTLGEVYRNKKAAFPAAFFVIGVFMCPITYWFP